jgi:hypothetical protein
MTPNLFVALAYAAAGLIGGAIIIGVLWSLRKQAGGQRPFYGRAGVVALCAAAIPSAVQYVATSGQQFWAGAPLLIAALALFARGLSSKAESRPAIMTFREKSALASAAAVVLVYGWASYQIVRSPQTLESAFGWLVGSTIVLIVIMAASHILLALVRQPEGKDERDTLVGWRSSRNAYFVLSCAMWGVVGLVFLGAAPVVVVYAALGAFALAELARLTSELLYYRMPL